jgi:hypothetical protein
MPLLPPLPRWARWMEARHWMVAQTAEQPGLGAQSSQGWRAGVVPPHWRKDAVGGCAACGGRPCAATLKKTRNFFCEDTEVECMKQRAECECGTSEGTDTCVLSLSFIEITYSHSRFSTSTVIFWLVVLVDTSYGPTKVHAYNQHKYDN